jgi:hypothetical protein
MNAPAAMLFAARTAAWTLLFGGWLVLGALALHHGPAGALQFAPLALWLGTVALAQRALLRHPPGPWALRGGLLAAGAVAAAGVATSAWVPAALGWGVLLVLASTVVRRRRGAAPGPAASPRGPALLAALCAAAVVGDSLAGGAMAAMTALPAVLAVALAWVLPPGPPALARAGCRSGLFDCALGSPPWAAWTTPQGRLRAVAALAMLPMMALLPWMLEACRSEAGWWAFGPRTAVALHLLAMLLPAWWPRAVPAAGVAGLLVAGGGCALVLPGGSGLMLGMALQAAAWGCVWRDAVVPGQGAVARAHEAGGAGGVGALAVLALGAGLVAWPGPPATAVAAVAAVLGLAAALAWGSARAAQPSAHKRRVTA